MLDFTKNIVVRMLCRIWLQLEPARQLQFRLIFALTVMTAGAEILTLGALIPFIGALVAPENLLGNIYISKFISFLGFETQDSIVTMATIVFIIAIAFAGILRVLQVWVSVRVSYSCGSEIAEKLFGATLKKPYSEHLKSSSSVVISAIGKVDVVVNSLVQMVRLVGSVIITLTILTMLLFINTAVAIASFVFFAGSYYIISRLVRVTLLNNSDLIATHRTVSIKLLQDGLGGIRDILMNGTSFFFLKLFRDSDRKLRWSEGTNSIIEAMPRFLMETIGITFVAILAFILFIKNGNIQDSLPLLGVLALSAQRMLPALQQAYNAWTSIKGHQTSVNEILDILENRTQESSSSSGLEQPAFTSSLSLTDISFSYDKNAALSLKNINLTILKGQKIGIIGSTGSGKSTLIDLIMGLLRPNAGELSVDGSPLTDGSYFSWRKNISHVPQDIFLSDRTIFENIAFGEHKNEIDAARVLKAAKRACVMEFVELLPQQLDTVIGERGLMLSGGERQRIGIARALYKNANLIIFDEATSALDEKTEQKIMKSIDRLSSKKTIIIVTHRISTLKKCDKVFVIDKGMLVDKKIL